jgi:hypothetical protein
MNKWDTKWMELMEENELEVKTGVRYMDDIRAFMNSICEGWRWWKGTLCYCEAWRDEDLAEGLTNTGLEMVSLNVSFMKSTVIHTKTADKILFSYPRGC